MDIKRAKQEIIDSVEAYLQKDAYGEYCIPTIRQRPILLMGPPGIGKTQIMGQIAKECNINLVAYTITHHTRQSAIGLPFIEKKEYQGKEYSVTEYTMSEIIASVYDKIEKTKIKEGILFIDEINCVSETLAPTMLQFLQCKMFGNQQIPEGWIIVAAGNPPEYNKSVREFDIVTLDRIKKIDVRENFDVWKEYAYQAKIHPAIIAYLEIKRENFYRIETTVDGKLFATARGWEDLSEIIKAYQKLGKTVDRDVVFQYIQHWKIAKDFANYLELYKKYKEDYQVESILQGNVSKTTLEQLKHATFDERVSVIGLLMSKLGDDFTSYHEIDTFVTQLHQGLTKVRDGMSLSSFIELKREQLDSKIQGELINKKEERVARLVIQTLEKYQQMLQESNQDEANGFSLLKEEFQKEIAKREARIEEIKQKLEYAFLFMEQAFGESQEMTIFVTELNTSKESIDFIKENGCDLYYQYNKGLLLEDREQDILKELNQVEKELSR